MLNRITVILGAAIVALALMSAPASATTTPTVTSVSPNTGPTTGGTSITITGTGFTSPATVVIGQGKGTIGAIPCTNVNIVSPTEITATTGGGALAGKYSLYVTASRVASPGSSGSNFTYSAAGAIPTVTNVSPNTGGVGGGTAITITGTGFTSPATVAIGQGNGTTGAIAATNLVVVSSTEITATTGGGAKSGTFSLFVTTSGGTSAANSGANFTYTSLGETPVVQKVTPNTGPTTGGTAIIITGTGFTSPATVVIGQGKGTIGAIPCTNVDVVRSSGITATVGGGAKAGTFNLYVIESGGTSAAGKASAFTYTIVG